MRSVKFWEAPIAHALFIAFNFFLSSANCCCDAAAPTFCLHDVFFHQHELIERNTRAGRVPVLIIQIVLNVQEPF